MQKMTGRVISLDFTLKIGEAEGDDGLNYGIDLEKLDKSIELEIGTEILFEPLAIAFTSQLLALNVELLD